MCDYSLHGIDNRLAAEGETLVVHRFRTGSMGMAVEADVRPGPTAAKRPWYWPFGRPVRIAVCIPPGARLTLKDVPLRLQRELGVSGTEEVMFTQLTAETNTHRDAVRFRNGAELLLQRLDPGQRVDVVSLCATETSEQPMTASEEAPSSRNWV